MDCIKVVIHLFKSLRAFWKHSQMLTKMEGLLLTSRVRFFFFAQYQTPGSGFLLQFSLIQREGNIFK